MFRMDIDGNSRALPDWLQALPYPDWEWRLLFGEPAVFNSKAGHFVGWVTERTNGEKGYSVSVRTDVGLNSYAMRSDFFDSYTEQEACDTLANYLRLGYCPE